MRPLDMVDSRLCSVWLLLPSVSQARCHQRLLADLCLVPRMNLETASRYAYGALWPCAYWAAMIMAGLALASVVCLAVLMVLHIMFQCRQIRAMPEHIPWAGLDDNGLLPTLRATLASWSRGRDCVTEAWGKVSDRCVTNAAAITLRLNTIA
jgi:hypothetical protein